MRNIRTVIIRGKFFVVSGDLEDFFNRTRIIGKRSTRSENGREIIGDRNPKAMFDVAKFRVSRGQNLTFFKSIARY